MSAIDKHLSEKGLEPFQRPLHVGRLLWQALSWEGPIFPPKALAEMPGFKGDVLIAKANRWYEDFYGGKLKSDFAYGFAPVKLGNAIWRVRAAIMYGEVQIFADRNLSNLGVMVGAATNKASFNVLSAIEDLPQGFADRLTDVVIGEYMHFYVFIHENLKWRNALPENALLEMARADYDASTMDVLARRYGQARWGAQQALEKTLKGLLTFTGTPFPTGGPNGHNLKHLGEILEKEHGVAIAPVVLSLASCSPKVRYGEEPSTEQEALRANHAVLVALEALKRNPKTRLMLPILKK